MFMRRLREQFTSRQWLTFIVFSVANFCQAVCVSLQAPFYPAEAESKGASATAYGLVFGIFELTVFIVSPIIGQNLNKLKAKRCFNIGLMTTGTCSILFGFLDKFQGYLKTHIDPNWFIGLSLLIRSLEAVGNSCFLNAAFSIIAKEFPSNMATMFAFVETSFGLGLIVGPSLGSFLYNLQGFTLPFAALGAVLVITALTTVFILPSDHSESELAPGSGGSIRRALAIPSVALVAFSVLFASSSIGFILASLEPHLRQFHLKSMIMSLMFVINGGAYGISAPIFGIIIDKNVSPFLINFLGGVCITLSFVFLGPAPFIPLKPILDVCIACLVVHGISLGAVLVSSFTAAHREVVKHGFPDNIETYGVVSGLWTSVFAFGAFVGPSAAGILIDVKDFRHATLFIVVFGLVLIMLYALFFGQSAWLKRKRAREGYESLEHIDGSTVASTSGGAGGDRSPSIGYSSGSGSAPPSSNDPSPGSARATRVPFSPSSGPALSPTSPYHRGATSMLGGVMGFSAPLSASHSSDIGHVDTVNELPHEYNQQQHQVMSGPPTRGQVRQPKSRRKT